MRKETYGGWTSEEIEKAIVDGDYIPSSVYIAYSNGDTDQSFYMDNDVKDLSFDDNA